MGEMTREARLDKGLTQLELARKVGCGVRTIMRLEGGESWPLAVYRKRIERILNIRLLPKEAKDEGTRKRAPHPGG